MITFEKISCLDDKNLPQIMSINSNTSIFSTATLTSELDVCFPHYSKRILYFCVCLGKHWYCCHWQQAALWFLYIYKGFWLVNLFWVEMEHLGNIPATMILLLFYGERGSLGVPLCLVYLPNSKAPLCYKRVTTWNLDTHSLQKPYKWNTRWISGYE